MEKVGGVFLLRSPWLCVSDLLVEFVCEGVGHHGLPCARWTVEQHHHPCPVRDDIIQTHLLTTALVRLKVTHSHKNQVFLLFGEDDLCVCVCLCVCA